MIRVWPILVLLASAGGCGASAEQAPDKMTPTPPPPTTNVQIMNLAIQGQAIGPDGFLAIVSFYRDERVFPLMVKGTVEIRVFEFASGAEADAMAREPFQTWSFSSPDLDNYIHSLPYRTGWGYYFPLPWSGRAPGTDKVIVQARFRGPSGDYLNAKPLTVPMSK